MKKLVVIFVMLAAMNANAQWVQMSNGITTSTTIWSFATLGNNIFAGSYKGIYRSSNDGTNWTLVGLNNLSIYSLAISGNNIFAGVNNFPEDSCGVYISTNNGTNWTQTSLNHIEVPSLAVLGNYIFAGTGTDPMDSSYVYSSPNNGTNWAKTSLKKIVYSFAISGNNIFAGTHGNGIYLSTNNGISWSQSGLNGNTVLTFAISGNNFFAGTEGNVYISTNNGLNWNATSLGRNTMALATYENNVFAGTWDGVYFSTNSGTNWVEKNQGFVTGDIPAVDAFIISNNYIFAGTNGNKIWRRSLSEIVGIQNYSSEIPSKFSISQNYPNPFNPVTVIRFNISGFPIGTFGNDKVMLKVYDVMGREVQTLVNESLKPGTYEVTFDGTALTSGVYFYILQSGDFVQAKRMLLIK